MLECQNRSETTNGACFECKRPPAVQPFLTAKGQKGTAEAFQYTMTVAGVEFECSVVEYPSFIANLPTLQEPHYVLYTADIDEATQQPWCPDCQQADPIVEDVIKQTGGTLLKVKVGDKASWKSQDHPFRQDPQLRLTSIPTLMHWKADSTCPGKQLDNQLASTHSESDIKQAVLAFTVKAKEQDA